MHTGGNGLLLQYFWEQCHADCSADFQRDVLRREECVYVGSGRNVEQWLGAEGYLDRSSRSTHDSIASAKFGFGRNACVHRRVLGSGRNGRSSLSAYTFQHSSERGQWVLRVLLSRQQFDVPGE